MDDDLFDRFIKDTLKLLRGSDAETVCDDLNNLAKEDPKIKEEFCVIAVTAASGARVNVNNLDNAFIKDIPNDKLSNFRIGTGWNFSKLSCAGHLILENSESEGVKKVQEGMTRRIGGKSIFSMDITKISVSKERAKILEENRRKWGIASHNKVKGFLLGTRFSNEA